VTSYEKAVTGAWEGAIGLSKRGPRARRILLKIILTVVLIYLGIVALAFFLQSRLVYFPRKEIGATPERVGLSYEAVWFQAADALKLSGWFIPVEKPRGILLFCHGNAGNISDRLDSIKLFHSIGLSTFIFDYRGYGQSEGKPTERGTYLDAEAAWSYLVNEREVSSDKIILFGRSLGGAVGAWLAREHAPGALILESTFTSIPDLGARLYPFLPVRLISRFRYSAIEYVKQAKCPVLVVHSRADELIPFRHGRRLFEAANEPKEFLEIAGSHNEGFITTGQRYTDGLAAFLSRHAAE